MSRTTKSVAYSIAAVSKLTGVSCHALRVWERRYGFPIPERSASGHRRYGHQQVSVLRVLAKLTRGGRPIGELIGEYQAGRLDLRVAVGAGPRRSRTPASWSTSCSRATRSRPTSCWTGRTSGSPRSS